MPTARVALVTLIVCAAPCVALAQSNYRSPGTVFNDFATAFGGGVDVQAGFHISYNFTRVSASP